MKTVIFEDQENTIKASDLFYSSSKYYGVILRGGLKCILTQKEYTQPGFFMLLIARDITSQNYVKTTNHNETFVGMMRFLKEYGGKLFVFNDREEFYEWLKKD